MIGRLRPVLADEGDDARDLLDDARGRIDAGGPQPRCQQMAAAEDVQRQVAVAVVEAVIVAAFLVAMQGHVGRIRIEHDDLRRRRVRLPEDVEEQPVDRGAVVADLVIAVGRAPLAFLRGMLEPIERALAGERGVPFIARGELAHHRCQQRIMAQQIMVVDIRISERLAHDPLANQSGDAVLDQIGIAPVRECGRDALDQADRLVGLGQQQRATI
jgi:hypothetical protein